MRDKPKMKTSMRDVADGFREDNGKKLFFMGDVGGPTTPAEKIIHEKLELRTEQWDVMEKEINEYNEKVPVLDPDYQGFTPLKDVIVRCFHREMQYQGEGDARFIVSPPTVHVPEQTSSGLGVRAMVESPYAYSRKAVIVSVPDGFETYKPGDVVQVHPQCVMPEKINYQDFHMPFAFTLHNYQDFSPPKDKKDKHFGYLIIDPYRHIQGKINK